MKKLLIISILFLGIATSCAQADYYTKRGVAIEGYDITEYFNNTAVKGTKEYTANHDGATFYFASAENKALFKANPEKYLPEYGGYCAYAIGAKAKKVSIDPKTFEIRNGKLYLFYNSFGTNTLDLWNEEGAEALRIKADQNWVKIMEK